MLFQPFLSFTAASSETAQHAKKQLESLYPVVPVEHCDILIVLGGDGFMLQTLKSSLPSHLMVYGMNLGSVGFLMNAFQPEALYARLTKALKVTLHPLKMIAETQSGDLKSALALNEVSLLRQTHQAAHISISVDHVKRLDQLVGDGILVSTPAGSTAYNFSAHGPIIPIQSDLLALTPICPFRPRRWQGALLPFNSHIRFEVLDPIKRPVNVTADSNEIFNIQWVEIYLEKSIEFKLLFDSDHALEERILREQFGL